MNAVCSICTTDLYAESSDVRVTRCGHLYHYKCLSNWLTKARSCPECRANCSPKSLIRLYLNVDEEPGEREVRVQRLVAQLERELNRKLSVSTIMNGSATVESGTASAATKDSCSAPKADNVVSQAGPSDASALQVDQHASNVTNSARTLQLPRTLQETMDSLRQTTALLAAMNLRAPIASADAATVSSSGSRLQHAPATSAPRSKAAAIRPPKTQAANKAVVQITQRELTAALKLPLASVAARQATQARASASLPATVASPNPTDASPSDL